MTFSLACQPIRVSFDRTSGLCLEAFGFQAFLGSALRQSTFRRSPMAGSKLADVSAARPEVFSREMRIQSHLRMLLRQAHLRQVRDSVEGL